ncbi:hypothetical protein EVAR_94635_1 [Eumeta japonica]|uniref:Uncharacterized protein n=1 Tax=Eumeta variegata TaxID=151549 RepID=A0A4C1UTN6_EUMVA|nr:hypothetical protein EVAR_94635_1 [Eumeta japonica]
MQPMKCALNSKRASLRKKDSSTLDTAQSKAGTDAGPLAEGRRGMADVKKTQLRRVSGHAPRRAAAHPAYAQIEGPD